MYVNLRHINIKYFIIIIIIIINFLLLLLFFDYHDSESLRKDNASSFQATKLRWYNHFSNLL